MEREGRYDSMYGLHVLHTISSSHGDIEAQKLARHAFTHKSEPQEKQRCHFTSFLWVFCHFIEHYLQKQKEYLLNE